MTAKGAIEVGRDAAVPAVAPADATKPPGRRPFRLGLTHLLLVVALAVHAILFLVILPSTHEDVVERGFVRLSLHDSTWTLTGAVPYRDFLLEYPPGTLLFMVLPRLLSTGYMTYRTMFFWENAVLDAVVVVALWATARAVAIPAWRTLLLYTVAIGLLGPTVVYRLDLAPVALAALGLLAWLHNRPRLAGIALAAGTATKIYPGLLLPLFVIDALVRRDRRRVQRTLLAFAITLALWLSPIILAIRAAGLQPVLHSVSYQTNRHTQVESLWATPALLAHLLTHYPLVVAGRARALVILGPGDALGALGTPAAALIALYVYWRWWRSRVRSASPREALLEATSSLVMVAAILSRVLSPQYLLWAIPLMVLLPLRHRWYAAALVAFGTALPLTQWIYPLHYGDLVRLLLPLPVGVLALRNLCLALALLALLAGLWTSSRPAAGQP